MANLYSIALISAWIIIIILSAFVAKIFFPKKKELSRKIVHIGIGPILPFAWWLDIPPEIAISVAITVSILLLINYRLKVIDIFENIERKSYGTIAYGISISILLITFWSTKPDAACAGVLIMAFGDGFAGLIGKQIDSQSWTIFKQRKSLAGTASMALISGLVLVIWNVISGNTLNNLDIITIAFLAMGLEQIGPYGIDNLTVPIGVAIGWSYFT